MRLALSGGAMENSVSPQEDGAVMLPQSSGNDTVANCGSMAPEGCLCARFRCAFETRGFGSSPEEMAGDRLTSGLAGGSLVTIGSLGHTILTALHAGEFVAGADPEVPLALLVPTDRLSRFFLPPRLPLVRDLLSRCGIQGCPSNAEPMAQRTAPNFREGTSRQSRLPVLVLVISSVLTREDIVRFV